MRSKTFTSLLLLSSAAARCFDPSPAFPLPSYDPKGSTLTTTFAYIESQLSRIVARPEFNRTSFSIEVTSSKETLLSVHHTAAVFNSSTRRGARQADDTTAYRIASITKVFTVLGILYQNKAGKLHLDDSVLKYIPALNMSQKGHLPWHDITIRTLASQLSGIPRNVLQQDLMNAGDLAEKLGLPTVSRHGLPDCDEYSQFNRSCSTDEFLNALKKEEPLFAPNQKSTYSNDAFSLLGLVLENITGMSYSKYIEKEIFKPLGMSHSSLEKPKDSNGMIPEMPNYWDVDEGVQRPTGGIYTSSKDMSKFLRYVLTHYNGITPSLNWLNTASFGTGTHSFYGMPWEIFTTGDIIPGSRRPVTFFTKGGGLPAYFSNIIIAPEHDLGITVLIAGEYRLLAEAREAVTVPLIRAADNIAMKQLDRYLGTYTSKADDKPPATLSITKRDHSGLLISDFVINGTRPLEVLDGILSSGGSGMDARSAFSFSAPKAARMKQMRAQLTPTLLFADQPSLKGERWRIEFVEDAHDGAQTGVWDNFCLTNVDKASYAGKPLNEIVFWEDKEGAIAEIELPAWRISLTKGAESRRTEESQEGKVATDELK